MNYQDYKQILMDELWEQKPQEISEYQIKTIIKQNEKISDCVTPVYADGGNLAPILYLEQFYNPDYDKEQIKTLASQLTNHFLEAHRVQSHFDISQINPHTAQTHLTLRLYNRSLNPEIEQTCAHIDCLDLMAVPRWIVGNTQEISSSFLVNRDVAAGIEPGEARLEGHSTCDLLNPKIDPLNAVFGVRGIEGLYIVPSDIELAMMEKKLIIQMNGEIKLRAAIRKLREHFDYIFIDCPPQLGQLSINALVAADEVVIPCKTDYLSYRGLKALIETIEEVREEQINPDIVIVGIIATFLEARVKDQQAVLRLMQEQDIPIIGTVRKSADVSRNLVKGMPVMIALPGSDVAQEYITIANKL